MPVETLTYTYTSQDEITRIISAAGVNLRIADLTSTMKTEYWEELIAEATDIINQYVGWLYDASAMADNRWVRARATWIALTLLCRRRANEVPKGILQRYNEILEELLKVQTGLLLIPRLYTSANMLPAMSNLEVDQRFMTRKIRVMPTISTGGYSSAQDMSWDFAFDWY